MVYAKFHSKTSQRKWRKREIDLDDNFKNG